MTRTREGSNAPVDSDEQDRDFDCREKILQIVVHRSERRIPRVELVDALAICLAIREREPQRFERAALRWLARFCLERREATIAQVQAAAWALENLTDEPAALETLNRLCAR